MTGTADEDPRSEELLSATESDPTRESADSEGTTEGPVVSSEDPDAPVVAKLVDPAAIASSAEHPESTGEDSIRVGSPFREDPPAAVIATVPEASYAEFGPYVYTAMGASVAAVLVAFFAIAGSVWFPAGGTVVALLGGLLSMVGLFSAGKFRWIAFASLFTHGGLFFLSYIRWLS